jgi:hypothetical protein
MTKPVTWSHSSLKDFEGCPKRYHEVKVLKRFPFKETEQIRYGNEVHKAAEKYTLTGEKTPGYDFMWPIIDALLEKPGKKFGEQKMALTRDLDPCDWFAPNVWVRGIADLLIIDDENQRAWIVDYKTGNDKYPDTDQLDLMALMTFAHYPRIKVVHSALLFVVKNSVVKSKTFIDDSSMLWVKYRERVGRIDEAHRTKVWNPTPTPLCRFCPVTDCVNHPE